MVIALDDHDLRSGTPAYKSAPVRLRQASVALAELHAESALLAIALGQTPGLASQAEGGVLPR